jgi:hypothetical protein
LNLPLGWLKSEHADFQRVSARRKFREFVHSRFVGCGYGSVLTLGRDYSRARYRLPAEFHDARLRA